MPVDEHLEKRQKDKGLKLQTWTTGSTLKIIIMISKNELCVVHTCDTRANRRRVTFLMQEFSEKFLFK